MKLLIMKLFSLVICSLFLMVNTAFAQDNPNEEPALEKVTITLNSGNKFTGEILQQYPDSVIISHKNLGEITILHKDIKKVIFIQNMSDSEIEEEEIESEYSWFKNPSPNYFLIGGNAISHKKGQWVYQNGMLVYNALSVGITDNFSLKVSSFVGISAENIILHPKVTFPVVDNFHLGFGTPFVITKNGWGAFPQIITTVGNKDRNLSFTIGLIYDGAENSFLKIPIFSVSGIYRVSKRVGLMTENWLARGDNRFISNFDGYEILSYGVRIYLKNLSFDFVLVNNRDIASAFVLGFPAVSVSVSFGAR